MKALIVALALVTVGCGSSPTSPTPPPVTPPVVVVPPVTPPIVQRIISVSPCPTSTPGLDLGFYMQIGCNNYQMPLESVRRWTRAPKVYLRTIDEAGAPIDSLTLDTVQNAMIEVAPAWTGGHFGLEGVLRGTDSREGVSGWITVKWPTISGTSLTCGRSDVAIDGGKIELQYKVAACACNGSAMRPRTARHELGHALGYFHTDNASDLMSGLGVVGCDAMPSAREVQAAAFQYR